mmetsp:Transcript_9961/g.13667  ORF Transcript_9961/g.13667 Transcript_9961/m.13667 type:complete len:677 (+) Transcript_9961:8-2038(+)
MGAVASINHAHIVEKEEKHEDVHKVVSKLPQYGIVGHEQYNQIVSNGSVSMKKLRELDPYLKYGGQYDGDEKDTEDFKYLTFKELPMFGPEHKSFMSKILTEQMFENLKSKKSSKGYTLSNAIMTGVVTPSLQIGATAGDEDSWEVFKELFYPIIQALHGYDATSQSQPIDLDSKKIVFSEKQKILFEKFVLSTRIRAVRNISGFALPAGSTAEDRLNVESILKKAFAGFSGDFAGTYYDLGSLTEEQTTFLRKRGFLFSAPTARNLLTGAGAVRSWPNNRGIFHNDTQTALVWVNESDHCRIISMELGGDVVSVFDRFCRLSQAVTAAAEADNRKIMWSDKLGFLGTCPSNLGTGLRASVMTVLPEFKKQPDTELLSSVCSVFDLLAKPPVNATGVESLEDQRYDISNRERLGVSEVQLVQKLVDGVSAVLRIEQKLAEGMEVAAVKDLLAVRTIFVGPPGCGKGTQAVKIRQEFNLAHLSTGDMLRAAVKAGTQMGQKAHEVMQKGELVSDDIVVGIIAEAITSPSCANGFILDGFPRNVSQANMLDELLQQKKQSIDCVINLAVDDELLIKRITGRLTHPPSGRSYNIYFNPPKVENTDDVTGEPLIKRADDNEETLRQRLDTFHGQTAGVLQHYSAKVINIKGDGSMENITTDIRMALKELKKQKLNAGIDA